VRRIHTATLDVIESIGVRFPSKKALDILEAHGATVDRNSHIAKIPATSSKQRSSLRRPHTRWPRAIRHSNCPWMANTLTWALTAAASK